MKWTPSDLVKVLLSVIPKCYLRAGDQWTLVDCTASS
jgi:hypothetical protein